MTRLKLKSLKYLIPFAIENQKINRQIKSSPGFLKGESIVSDNLVAWTKTLWVSRQSVEDFYLSGVHGQVIKKIGRWSSESVTANQQVETNELPAWQNVATQLSQTGRLGKRSISSENNPNQIILPPHIIFKRFQLLPISSLE